MLKGILHIYPTHGSWLDTDMVEVVDKPAPMSISEAVEAGRMSVFTRDHIFTAISHPSLRNRYEDVVYHADPRTVTWCFICKADRSRAGGVCDTCLQSFEPPF